MNLLLVDDEIAMLHIMEKAIDWKKKGIQKVFYGLQYGSCTGHYQ